MAPSNASYCFNANTIYFDDIFLASRAKIASNALGTDGDMAGIGIISKNGFDQLKIAHGDGVKHQAVLALVVADAIHMVECPALGGADVMQHRAGSGCGGGAAGESEALQREHAKMIFHQGDGVVGGEDPIFEGGGGGTPAGVE